MKSTSQRNQGVNDIGKLVYLGFVLSFSFGAHLWQFTRSTLARRRGLKFWPDFLRQYRQHALNIFFILLFWSQGTPRVHLSISTLFIKRASNNAQVHCSLVFSFAWRAWENMSFLLPHLRSGWAVDQAILTEEERLVVLRFGRDADDTCMRMDEVRCHTALHN